MIRITKAPYSGMVRCRKCECEFAYELEDLKRIGQNEEAVLFEIKCPVCLSNWAVKVELNKEKNYD